VEGKRKQVTVLFADPKGSMELLADRDPEEARQVFDPVMDRMMEAVHRYEGTVNQVMGDGIMALFGAPLAHEDHAIRACYAALVMQEALRHHSAEVRRRHGVEGQIRVGLNSGEVVVRSIGNDLDQVFGKSWLPSCLVVDRYGGYNKVLCALQYCYSHLLREVQDLEKEFPEAAEVKACVSTVAPQLALAMGLRAQPLSDSEFARQAAALKAQIMASMQVPAQHRGIHRLQEIFRANADRLYHWADNRRVPAENNLAERDRRPTVLARKVSCGSRSDSRAHTRGSLMSALHTLKKRHMDVVAHLKRVLDHLAFNLHQDPFPLLFPTSPP
jgi:hypothetical protein